MTARQEAIDRLRRELDRLVAVESVGVMVKVADLAALLASHDNLEVVLAFYADRRNWQSPSSGFALQYDPKPSPVSGDQGIRARAALATPEGPA
jgi:hypothetical protein